MLHRGSNCSLARVMDGHIMRCGIISSFQSAATSEIVKALLCMCHDANSAIKYRTFTFYNATRNVTLPQVSPLSITFHSLRLAPACHESKDAYSYSGWRAVFWDCKHVPAEEAKQQRPLAQPSMRHVHCAGFQRHIGQALKSDETAPDAPSISQLCVHMRP